MEMHLHRVSRSFGSFVCLRRLPPVFLEFSDLGREVTIPLRCARGIELTPACDGERVDKDSGKPKGPSARCA
jgi:hypothetical protein